MNNKLKLIFYYIKLFIFSILVFMFSILFILNNTVLTEKYHLNKMNDKYYEKLDEEIYESIKINTMAAQFDESIIHKYYTKQDIKEHVIKYMDYLFNKSDKKLDLSNIETKIRNAVNEYLKENDIDDTDEKSINKYVKTVLKIYEEKITVMNFTKLLRNSVVKLHNLINIILIVLLAIIIIFMLLVRKNIKLYLFVPLYVLGMLFILISIMLQSSIDITYLTLITYSISDYIRLILSDIIKLLFMSGTLSICIGIVLNVILVLKNPEKWNILEK